MLGPSLHLCADERHHVSVLFLSCYQHCRNPKGESYWLAFPLARGIPAQGYCKVFQANSPPCLVCSLLPTRQHLILFPHKTKQAQITYLMYVLAFPSGKTYGCFFRKTCPTRLQGMISRLPPHIHTRKEISTKEAASESGLSVLKQAGSWRYLPLHPLPH